MSAPVLPFEEFLDALATKQIVVGVRERLALGKVLARFDGYSREQLKDAIAALLARNDYEVTRIGETFDEFFRDRQTPPPLPPTTTLQPEPTRLELIAPFLRGFGLAVGLTLGAAGIWSLTNGFSLPDVGTVEPTAPPGPPTLPPETGTFHGGAVLFDNTTCDGVRPRKYLTREWNLTRLGRGIALVTGLLLAMSLLRARRRRRMSLDEHSRAELDRLSPPRDFVLRVPPVNRRAEARAYSALATALERIARGSANSGVDMARTIRRSLQCYPRITLVPRVRHTPEIAIVAIDTATDMAPWIAKVDALCSGLERHGVRLQRLYFHNNLDQVSVTKFGAREPLSRYARAHAGAPLVVVSCSGSATDESLGDWTNFVWLDPVADPESWHDGIDRHPAYPITAEGLTSAARAVANPRGLSIPHRATHVDDPERVQLFSALLSLIRRPTYPTAELLRATLFPELSDAAILASAEVVEGRYERPEGLLHKLDPTGESQRRGRELFGTLLASSEPEAGSAAHLRWRHERAVHRAALGDMAGVAELRELAMTPILGEVITSVDLGQTVVGANVERTIRARASRAATVPTFARPHIVAVLAAAVIGVLVVRQSRDDVTRSMTLRQAYELDETLSNAPEEVDVIAKPGAPAKADVYLGSAVSIRHASIPPGSSKLHLAGVKDRDCLQLEAVVGTEQFISNELRYSGVRNSAPEPPLRSPELNGSGAAPTPPLSPPPPAFYCFRWLWSPGYLTSCYRSQNACDKARKSLPTNDQECTTASTASCTKESGNEECFATVADCSAYAEARGYGAETCTGAPQHADATEHLKTGACRNMAKMVGVDASARCKLDDKGNLIIDATIAFAAYAKNSIDFNGGIVFRKGGAIVVPGGMLTIHAKTIRADPGGRITIDGRGSQGAAGERDLANDGNGGVPRRPKAEKYDPDGRPHWETANASEFTSANNDCSAHRGGEDWGLAGLPGAAGGPGAKIEVYADSISAPIVADVTGGAGGAGGPGGLGARHALRGTSTQYQCPDGPPGVPGTRGNDGACKLVVNGKDTKCGL